jgi:hypothetical protein
VVLVYISETISTVDELKGQRLVTFYHAAVILHTFATTSIASVQLMKKHFSEEFK